MRGHLAKYKPVILVDEVKTCEIALQDGDLLGRTDDVKKYSEVPRRGFHILTLFVPL